MPVCDEPDGTLDQPLRLRNQEFRFGEDGEGRCAFDPGNGTRGALCCMQCEKRGSSRAAFRTTTRACAGEKSQEPRMGQPRAVSFPRDPR